MAKLKVRWTKQAVDDLNCTYDYLMTECPSVIPQIIAKILDGIERVQTYPGAGRLGRVRATRELVITSTPFILVYREENKQIEILSIIHSARKWP